MIDMANTGAQKKNVTSKSSTTPIVSNKWPCCKTAIETTLHVFSCNHKQIRRSIKVLTRDSISNPPKIAGTSPSMAHHLSRHRNRIQSKPQTFNNYISFAPSKSWQHIQSTNYDWVEQFPKRQSFDLIGSHHAGSLRKIPLLQLNPFTQTIPNYTHCQPLEHMRQSMETSQRYTSRPTRPFKPIQHRIKQSHL
jgi:hypothetical protein